MRGLKKGDYSLRDMLLARDPDHYRKAGAKARDTMLAKDPDFYRRIGAAGGVKGRTGGFYKNRELASAAGKKGGKNSWKSRLEARRET